MAYIIRRLTEFSEFDAVQADWNLVANLTPFSSWQWLRTWAENYIRSEQLYTVIATTDTGQFAGILPLYRDQSMLNGRDLRLLGAGEVCTDYLSLFAAPGHRVEVADAIAQWLSDASQDENDGWDSIVLDHVHDVDPSISDFVDSMQVYGNRLQSTSAQNCWRIELPDSWDDYLALMSKSHRKQLRRVDRALIDSGKAKLHTVASADELPRAMEILVDLHQKRRNRLGQPGCFASNQFSSFLFAVSRQLLSAGMLRLHWIDVAEQPIAAEFQVSDGRTVYAYQAGVDPDAMELEPGRLIMIATIRDAIESGCQVFDFLRGDEPYKAHFRAQPRTTSTLRIVAQSHRAQIHQALRSAKSMAKGWAKSAKSLVGEED